MVNQVATTHENTERRLFAHPQEELLDTTGNKMGRLTEQLRAMQVEADKILKGHVDRNFVQKAVD